MQADEARELLTEISEGRGPYKLDNHDFACSVIETAKANAKKILELLPALLAHHALEARKAALEEAASFCEGFPNSMTALSLARGIRSLAERASKGAAK